jgi:hypothetical protein
MKEIEKKVENEILFYLDSRGLFPIKLENQGTFDPVKKIYRGNRSKYKRKGMSDIYFTYYGKPVFIEVKTPKNFKYIVKHYEELENGLIPSQSRITDQINFMKEIEKRGGFAYFCDSAERAEKILDNISYKLTNHDLP